MLVAMGYSPQHVEREMSWPEMEVRFLDEMKLLQRQQQISSATLLGSVGSLLIKKGEKNFYEVTSDIITQINSVMGEIETAQEQQREETGQEQEDRRKAQEQKILEATAIMKFVNKYKGSGIIQSQTLEDAAGIKNE